MTFPVEGNWGNRVEFRDGLEWVDATGMDRNATSGTFTVSGLGPGRRYQVSFIFYDRHNETWAPRINIPIGLQLPPEQLQRFARSNMVFYLDQVLIDAWGPTRTNNFVNEVNRGYDAIHGLVGGPLPFNGAPIEFRSARNLPMHIEGTAGPGPIIRWQTSTLRLDGAVSGFNAIDHAHAMTHFGVNTTEMPFHEIAHHFDSPRWSFCEEAIAIFFTYYFYDMTGQGMAVGWQPRAFHGGAEFRAYMRSYANRTLHTGPSYDATVGQGIYGPYGLAWNLANIQTQIGWEPFRQTFRAFHELHPSQVPTTNIGKLNLFLTFLSDFSGRDVFTMFTAAERQVYQTHFGGTMQRVSVGQPDTTNHGVVHNGSIIRPITSIIDLNARLEITNLRIDTVNRWLLYDMTLHRPNRSWTSFTGGGFSLFNNPSHLRTGTHILGTGVSVGTNWDIWMSIEESADPAFLLPANANNLSGRTVLKVTLLHKVTGNIYYFEVLLPNSVSFTQCRSIAFNPLASNRVELNNNIHWYLNHSTVDGPASNVNLTSAQAGLPYNMARLRERIGHAPFNQAFDYMANLPAANLPSTQLGRVNLFLTKLRDFSPGQQSVIAMFTPQAIAHFEGVFGGPIRYVDGDVTITWHPYGTGIIEWRNVALGRLSWIMQLLGFNQLPNPGTRDGYRFIGWFDMPQPPGVTALDGFADGRSGAPLQPTEITGSTYVDENLAAYPWWLPYTLTRRYWAHSFAIPVGIANWTPSVSDNQNWLSASRLLDGRLRIEMTENPGSTYRTAEVTISSGSLRHVIEVTQEGGPFVQGIKVTVVDGAGQPIQGALVQFALCVNYFYRHFERPFPRLYSRSYRTNASGIATFPNAYTGYWGINVTHRDFVSTYNTSTTIRRTGATSIQNVSITMHEPASTFRSLGWGPLMADMGTAASPTSRVSSVYGWRSWGSTRLSFHNGIDLVAITGINEGRRKNNPFPVDGYVVFVYDNIPGAGNGIVIRYHDYSIRTDFYVRHLHLQHLPARARPDGSSGHLDPSLLLRGGDWVYAGEHVGRMGGTAGPDNNIDVHLHTDVHRGGRGPNRPRSIDPRAFYEYGFTNPWPDINEQ